VTEDIGAPKSERDFAGRPALPVRRLVKTLSLALVALAAEAALSSSFAECPNDYYVTKNSACLGQLISLLEKLPNPDQPTLGIHEHFYVGFLGAGVLGSQTEIWRAIDGLTSAHARAVASAALCVANRAQEANALAALAHFSAVCHEAASPPLLAISPVDHSEQNDLLIGAYASTGDVRYIEHILDNFVQVDRVVAAEAIRLDLVKGSKVGPDPPGGKGKFATIAKALCAKYDCRRDHRSFDRLLTLSSAHWALNSLSRSDQRMAGALNDFLIKHRDLAAIQASEEGAFYLYLLWLDGVKPIGHEDLPAKFIGGYESLKPADELVAPLKTSTGEVKFDMNRPPGDLFSK
jgi:hypothetical protein